MASSVYQEATGAAQLPPLREARFLLSAARTAQLPMDTVPEVAFAGRSNAGKSSALNRLCDQRNLARVGATPGRTQLLNLFVLPDGERLVDLPGYGYASAPLRTRRNWEALVGQYIAQRQNLAGVIVLVDIRHSLKTLDVQMLNWAKTHNRPVHLLLTKSDKLSRNAANHALRQLRKTVAVEWPGTSMQIFSARTGAGLEEACERIGKWLTVPGAATPDGT